MQDRQRETDRQTYINIIMHDMKTSIGNMLGEGVIIIIVVAVCVFCYMLSTAAEFYEDNLP